MRLFRKQRSKTGVAVVEFLFVAPAFFILVFFVIELALIWNDRHVMRLAAYRAARVVVKMRAEKVGANGLCWQNSNSADPDSVEFFKAARRSSAKVMSTITPTITQLLSMFGNPSTGIALESTIGADIWSKYGDGTDTSSVDQSLSSNPYVHAIFRMMKGLPAAWAFTELECANIVYPTTQGIKQNNGVEVKLTYHRSAKMPYVGTLMYLLRKLQEIAVTNGLPFDGVSGMIRVNPLNYGIEFKFDPNNPNFQTLENQWANSLKDKLSTEATTAANTATTKIQENLPNVGATLPSGDLVGNTVGTIFEQQIAPQLKNQLNNMLSTNANVVNAIGQGALDLFIQAPDELKTIPITVSVRIPNYSNAYVHSDQEWNGKAAMVGLFTSGDNMTRLARYLGTALDQEQPPNAPHGRGLPYVTP